jgi:hypothetical protein
LPKKIGVKNKLAPFKQKLNNSSFKNIDFLHPITFQRLRQNQYNYKSKLKYDSVHLYDRNIHNSIVVQLLRPFILKKKLKNLNNFFFIFIVNKDGLEALKTKSRFSVANTSKKINPLEAVWRVWSGYIDEALIIYIELL